MPQQVECQQCPAVYTIPDNLGRRSVRCRSCQASFDVGQDPTAITAQPPPIVLPTPAAAPPPATMPDLQIRSPGQKFLAALRRAGQGLLAFAVLLAGWSRAGFGKLHALATGERRRFYLPIILGGSALTLLLLVIGAIWAWNAFTSRPQVAGTTGGRPGAPTVNVAKGANARQHRQAWYQATVLEGYDRHGKKNAKWESAAREAFQVSLPHWDNPVWVGDFNDRAWDATKKAIDLGCDDPLLQYWYARLGSTNLLLSAAEVDRYYTQAAQGMKNSQYPPARKAMALAHAALHKGVNPALTPKEADQVFSLLEEVLAVLPDVARDRNVPGQEAYHICHVAEEVYWKMLGGNRKAAIDKVAAALQKDPACEPLLRTFLAGHYIKWAWEGRSAAWAKDVRVDQWQLFRDRLQLAGEEFTLAYRLDPANPAVPTQMITLELGQGNGKERMERVFQKAIELDPDNYEACLAKIYYLEPKWYGSERDMLEFGRQCRDGDNWDASIPLVLIHAHESLGKVQPQDAYFQQQPVWDDIRSVFEPRLKKHPELRYERSEFARWAVRCGQFGEAQRQFQALGDSYSRGAFRSQAEFQQMRQLAIQPAGKR